MKILIYVALSLIALSQIYLICLMGRGENKELNKFLKFRYAHRGLHSKPAIPENSLNAFSAAVKGGFGIELDVHLMADGKLAVIHDSSLKRTANADVKIEDLTEEDLKKYYLEGTRSKIPTLKQVLKKVNGKVPLLIELKSEGNVTALCETVANELKGYKGDYIIESFDPRCIRWFRKNEPQVVRGQLTQNFFKENSSNLSFPLRLILSILILNVWNAPDFIAIRYTDRKNLSNIISRKYWKLGGFAWTIDNIEDLEKAESEGYSVIFENIDL